jgi:hypothetical protein
MSSGSSVQSAWFTYSGWQFTSNMSPIPNSYVLISFQTMQLAASFSGASYFTFNITQQTIQKTQAYF